MIKTEGKKKDQNLQLNDTFYTKIIKGKLKPANQF